MWMPASDTSAIVNWLNTHSAFAIDMELYQIYWRENLSFPENAFEEDRFFDIKEGDTGYDSFDVVKEYYENLKLKLSQR